MKTSSQRSLSVLVLAAVSTALAAGCAAPREVRPGPPVVAAAESFEVIALQYANADAVADTIRASLGGRAVPDARTNSIVLSGTRTQIDRARDLARSLDVKVAPHAGG